MRRPPFDWRSAWVTLFGTKPPEDLCAVDPTRVKQAFRMRARQTHPDLAGIGATDQFRQSAEAYEILQNAIQQRPASEGVVRRRPPVEGRPIRMVQSEAPKTSVPKRRLALSQFLCHIGWVSWNAVMESVRWQRSNRLPMGTLAVGLGVLRDRDVRRILSSQRVGERFGACATRLGMLPRREVSRLLNKQLRLQPPIGQYFVQEGLLSAERVREAVALQREHNERVHRSSSVDAA